MIQTSIAAKSSPPGMKPIITELVTPRSSVGHTSGMREYTEGKPTPQPTPTKNRSTTMLAGLQVAEVARPKPPISTYARRIDGLRPWPSPIKPESTLPALKPQKTMLTMSPRTNAVSSQ